MKLRHVWQKTFNFALWWNESQPTKLHGLRIYNTTQHNTKANLKPLCYGMLEQTGVISFLKVNPCYTVFPPYLNEFELPRSFKARVDLLVLLY